jgi:large subunit ribosomal protein L9
LETIMKVILMEDVHKLGQAGAQVSVADGYARNYLIPRKLAVGASPAKQAIFDNEAKARVKKKEREKQELVALAAKLASLQLTISRLAGEDDKLFGSVTNGDIADALAKEGHKIDKRGILLDEPLKALGIHDVTLLLHPQVQAKIKVWVVKQEQPA